MGVNTNIIRWVESFLTERVQHVKVNKAISLPITTNTGAPQGSVISPVLFTLYTSDCRSETDDTCIVKFADDTAIVGLIENDELSYRRTVDEFAGWCSSNFLHLNIKKTKEVIFDFRTGAHAHQEIVIGGEEVVIVDEYKYLGTTIDSKLTWNSNTHVIYKKGQQRLHFMRRLRQYNVEKNVMTLFHRSFVESALTFCFVSWYGSLSLVNKNKLHKIINVSSKIAGVRFDSMTSMYETRVLRKGKAITRDNTHPLHSQYQLLPSGRRYKVPSLQARASRSFVPISIGLMNKQAPSQFGE